MGVVHGLKAFVPLLKRHGEGGHIVNTASMTGFVADAFGAYAAAKSGVIAISEALQGELASSGIGVSLLCPSLVNTRILECLRNWPKEYGPPPSRDLGPLAGRIAELMRTAMPPSQVAALVRKAVEENEFYIFTHPERRAALEERAQRFLSAYRKLDAVPQDG
jgi:NAD(P)-dependent dehydrogenase (short-subunit alcohol dehydrogenase family)